MVQEICKVKIFLNNLLLQELHENNHGNIPHWFTYAMCKKYAILLLFGISQGTSNTGLKTWNNWLKPPEPFELVNVSASPQMYPQHDHMLCIYHNCSHLRNFQAAFNSVHLLSLKFSIDNCANHAKNSKLDLWRNATIKMFITQVCRSVA